MGITKIAVVEDGVWGIGVAEDGIANDGAANSRATDNGLIARQCGKEE